MSLQSCTVMTGMIASCTMSHATSCLCLQVLTGKTFKEFVERSFHGSRNGSRHDPKVAKEMPNNTDIKG